ncbi:hypothetical protein Mapa_002682 [Marchantia paleacea]|nr:hypothetical protein Mapa_002682 [Marchantia paleacea]
MINIIVATDSYIQGRVIKLEFLLLLAISCACWMSEDVEATRVRFRNEYPSPEAEKIVSDIKDPNTVMAVTVAQESLRTSRQVQTPPYPPRLNKQEKASSCCFLCFSMKAGPPGDSGGGPSKGN